MVLERSRQLCAKPATARSSAIMALAVCFAAGYLLTRPCSEIRGGLTEQASAAESNETGATEERQTPSQPVSTDTICGTLAAAAAQNGLPADFFARLIWQESRFNPAAISRAASELREPPSRQIGFGQQVRSQMATNTRCQDVDVFRLNDDDYDDKNNITELADQMKQVHLEPILRIQSRPNQTPLDFISIYGR